MAHVRVLEFCRMLQTVTGNSVHMYAEAMAVAIKELKQSQEAHSKAHSSAESAARQADKLTQKLANMPKVISCCSSQCCRL